MKKPNRLKRGDTVAIVSLCRGILGEDWAIHKLDIAKQRLESDFGLKVVVMPNALKGVDFLYNHPELRAKDLMDAFENKEIKAIFDAIGGNDSIRLLPYINFDIIKNNPKIYTGFSDSTSIHFMLNKAGICSYYGASVMNNFAEYVKINDYTKNAIINILFKPAKNQQILPSSVCSYKKDIVWWKPENINVERKFYKDEHGYELLQGKGIVRGKLIGGCIDVFENIIGTKIWPKLASFKGKILCLETSDEDMPASTLEALLRNLAAQSIFDVINGVIIGKPASEEFYEEYKQAYKKVIGFEAKRPDLPILYNVNFGHAEPIGIIPLGINCQIDCENKTITLLEKPTK